MDRFKFIVINLESAIDRYNKIKEQFDKYNIEFIRANAIYGKNVKSNPLLSNICKYSCPDSTIGCGLSHMYVWKYIISRNDNYIYIILEDDVTIDFDNLIKNYEKIINIIDGNNYACDILYLTTLDIMHNFTNIKIIKQYADNYNLCKFSMITGMGAYVLNYNMAKYMLNQTNKLTYHIDMQINKIKTIRKYVIYPHLIKMNGLDDSSQIISNDKFILKYIKSKSIKIHYMLKFSVFSIYKLFIVNLYLFLLFILGCILYIFNVSNPIIYILFGFLLSDYF